MGGYFGRYRLLRRLGQGGMAQVYLAEMAGPGRFVQQVAVKRLLPEFSSDPNYIAMLKDEARVAAGIRHPNVTEVLDFGEVAGEHFIAMEYVEGVDIARVLRGAKATGAPLPIGLALFIARCVALGLEAAHSVLGPEGAPRPVVHRDVSPQNVLLSFDGAVKLIDFGVAKASSNRSMTRSGVIKGKLQYMSPEQALAESVDGRADVFSLGMTLFKMLTGRLPFSGRTEYQVYDQVVRGTAPAPRTLRPDLPELVDAIVIRALRKDKARRFQTAGEMATVLDQAITALGHVEDASTLSAYLKAHFGKDGPVKPMVDDDFERSAPAQVAVVPQLDARAVDRLTRVGVRTATPAQKVTTTGDLPKTVALSVPGNAQDPAQRAAAAARRSLTPAATASAILSEAPVATGPRWWAIAAFGLLLLCGSLGAMVWSVGGAPPPSAALSPVGSPSAPPVSVLSVGGTGGVEVAAAPLVAAPRVMPKTPLAPEIQAPQPRALKAPAVAVVSAKAPVKKRAGRARRRASVARGYLTINAVPWATVHVDGVEVGRTLMMRYPIKAGRHTIVLRRAGDAATEWRTRVKVSPGKETRVVHRF